MLTSPFVDTALARRLETGSTWRGVNYVAGYQKLHPKAACSVEEIGGGFTLYVGPGSPLNSARGLGMQGEVTRQDLEAVEDFFFSRGAAARVLACPLAHESLFDHLRASGFGLAYFFSQLFFPIPSDYRPSPLPEGMRVANAGQDQADVWLQVVAGGFEEGSQPTPETLDILGPNFNAPESSVYLAWLEGRPAGGGGMYFHDGVVELGGTSTLPEFRRRGVHRALIEARLKAARAMGCDLAVVLTEPGGPSQRNLQRIGFHLAYTKVVMVKAFPARAS